MNNIKKLLNKELYAILDGLIELEHINDDVFVQLYDSLYYKAVLESIQTKITEYFEFQDELHCVALSIILNEIHFKYSQRQMGLSAYITKVEMYGGVEGAIRVAKNFQKNPVNIEQIRVKQNRADNAVDFNEVPNSIIAQELLDSRDLIPDNIYINGSQVISVLFRGLPERIEELEQMRENLKSAVFNVSKNSKYPKVDTIIDHICSLKQFVSRYCDPKSKNSRNTLIAQFLSCVGMMDEFDESDVEIRKSVIGKIRHYIDSAEKKQR